MARRTGKLNELRNAVLAYLDAITSPASTERGCIEACEKRRTEMFALVGVAYPIDDTAPLSGAEGERDG